MWSIQVKSYIFRTSDEINHNVYRWDNANDHTIVINKKNIQIEIIEMTKNDIYLCINSDNDNANFAIIR